MRTKVVTSPVVAVGVVVVVQAAAARRPRYAVCSRYIHTVVAGDGTVLCWPPPAEREDEMGGLVRAVNIANANLPPSNHVLSDMVGGGQNCVVSRGRVVRILDIPRMSPPSAGS